MKKLNRLLKISAKSAVLVLVLSVSAFAVDSMDNESCMKCHGDDTIEAKTEKGEKLSLFVDEDLFSESVHEKLKCIECHIPDGKDAFKDEIHKIKKNKGCLECHGRYFEDKKGPFEKSVHYEKMKGRFFCQSCHNSHNVPVAEDPDMVRVSDIIEKDNKLCTDCHGNEKRFMRFSEKDYVHFSEAHDFLPNRELHWKKTRCIDCHTEDGDTSEFHNIVSREDSGHNCASCHSPETILTGKLYKRRTAHETFKFLKKGFFNDAGLIRSLEENGIDIEESMEQQVVDNGSSSGFINKYLFKDVYVIGATRNSFLDYVLLFFVLATSVVLLIHGLLRFIMSRRRAEEETGDYHVTREYLYSLNTRVWHWINAVLFIILALSGFLMHFGGFGTSMFGFEASVKIHNIAGPIMAVMYLVYIIGNIADGNYKNYIPRPKGAIERWMKQIRFYAYGIFRGEPHPHVPVQGEKFNPLQKFAYTMVAFVLFVILIATGVMLLFPDKVPARIMGYPGIYPVAVTHYVIAVFLVIFLLVHLYLVTTGHSLLALVKGMLDGHHEHREKK